MEAAMFLSAGAKLAQGIGGMSAANANARRMEEQAVEERRSSLTERNRLKDEQRGVIGQLLAAQVSNGLEGGSGTALNMLRQSQVNAALDVMQMRRDGELRARALRQQAADTRAEGRMALIEGVLGAGSSFIKDRSDWAQERKLG